MNQDFLHKISDLDSRASEVFKSVSTRETLEDFYQKFLGKKSELNQILKLLKDLPSEEKREVGPKAQAFQKYWEETYQGKLKQFEWQLLNEKLKADWIDTTKSCATSCGSIHPISQVQLRIETIFSSMGFEIAKGPEVETEWHNFDALNIPASHPARDMQDTFFVSSGSENPLENTVLRTHTSSVQIRKMIEKGAPLRIIAPGRVFRNEDIDATHDVAFYQVEGLLVDENISIAHLKGVVEKMLSAVFEKEMKTRIRPGYFPFVEPGLEVDIWWEYEKEGKKFGRWLEFMGAGMVHPNVLRNGGIDPEKYTGFAFGFGLTRLVMMKYGIDDIRLLYSNKKEFLQQF